MGAYIFRFAPEPGHGSMQSACLKRAKSGSPDLLLLDDLVGAGD